MISKNIIFNNFQLKKDHIITKKLNKILKKELNTSSSLLNSFTTNYKYSFKKNIIK